MLALSSPGRGRRAGLALLCAVLLAGCGSSDSSDGTSGGGDSSSPGDLLTAGQLYTVLLNVDELPAGYVIDPSPDEDDGEDQDFGTSDCARKLEELTGTEDETPAAAEVTRTFNTGEDGLAGLEQSVESYDDEDALNDSIDEFRDIVANCGQLTFSADGVPATLTVSEANVPEHGDDTLGFRMKGQISAFPFELVFGVNRLGHNIHMVMAGGLGEADMTALTQAMDTGFAKLEKAHETDPNAPAATPAPAEPDPTSTLRTGGPGTYTRQSESGVLIELDLPATDTSPLNGQVLDYLNQVGGEYADVQLVDVRVDNGSTDSTFIGTVTVVTNDGEQIELDSLVMLLNETNDSDPDAYSATGSDLNTELSNQQIDDLKPGAKGTQTFALRVPADSIKDVYVNVDFDDIQLGLE